MRAGAVARLLIPAIWAGALLLVLLQAVPALANETARGAEAYRAFPLIGSRLAVWAIAQIHLNFAAFSTTALLGTLLPFLLIGY